MCRARPGNYIWYAQLDGRTPDGVRFQRTTEHLVRIASLDAELSGRAKLHTRRARLVASIGVELAGDAAAAAAAAGDELRVLAYAELWTASGAPVAWASAECAVAGGAVELSFDARWLRDAPLADTAADRFELRHVYLSELAGFVPLSQRRAHPAATAPPRATRPPCTARACSPPPPRARPTSSTLARRRRT